MKIILQRSVDNLGDPGDIVTVKDGYARNYLVPRGLAVPASRGATRHVESLKRSHDVKIAKLRGAAEEVAGRVGGARITISMKAGEDGKLFGSVTAEAVAAAVNGAGKDIEVTKKDVELPEPIKSTGEHPVSVRLHPEVTAEVIVEVVGE